MVIISTLSSKIYYMQLSTKGRKCITFSMLVKLGSSWSIKCQEQWIALKPSAWFWDDSSVHWGFGFEDNIFFFCLGAQTAFFITPQIKTSTTTMIWHYWDRNRKKTTIILTTLICMAKKLFLIYHSCIQFKNMSLQGQDF